MSNNEHIDQVCPGCMKLAEDIVELQNICAFVHNHIRSCLVMAGRNPNEQGRVQMSGIDYVTSILDTLQMLDKYLDE